VAVSPSFVGLFARLAGVGRCGSFFLSHTVVVSPDAVGRSSHTSRAQLRSPSPLARAGFSSLHRLTQTLACLALGLVDGTSSPLRAEELRMDEITVEPSSFLTLNGHGAFTPLKSGYLLSQSALQSVRFGCSALGVTTAGRPLVGLAARPEFLVRRPTARIG
jgi:hypothetical protein